MNLLHAFIAVTLSIASAPVFAADEADLELIQRIADRGASCITLSNDGRFAYTTSVGTGLGIFKRDPETSQLNHIVTLKAPDIIGPIRGRISSDNKYLAVSDSNGSSVEIFKRDGATGGLTKVAFAGELNGIGDAQLSPDNHFVYTASGARLGVFKFEDDSLTPVQTEDAGGNLKGLRPFALSPNGRWLYTAAQQSGTLGTFRRDETSGKIEMLQMLSNEQEGITTLRGAYRLAVSSDGKQIYVSSGRDYGDQAVSVFEVQSDGTLKPLQQFTGGMDGFEEFEGGNEIGVSPDGKWVFAAATVSDRLFRFSRDSITGKLTFITSQQVGTFANPGANGVTFSPDGKSVYVADQIEHAIEVYKLP